MYLVGYLIDWVLWIFLLVLFARMILSWVPVLVRDWEPRGPMLVFAEIIYSITDPVVDDIKTYQQILDDMEELCCELS